MWAIRLALFSAALAVIQQSEAYAIAPNQYVGQRIASVSIANSEQAQAIHSLVHDVFDSRVVPGRRVRVRGTDEELETLRQQGYAFDVEVTDIAQHLRELENKHEVCIQAMFE
jgi:hypothetical protein